MSRNKIIITSIISVIILSIIGIVIVKELNNQQNNPLMYTVTFIDYDGTILKEEKVELNSSASAPNISTREGYNFIGWDKKFNNVTEDITVVALYKKNNKPKFVVNSVEANSGSIVEVTISVINNPDISSIALNVTFDVKLSLTNVIYNKEIGGYSMPPANMNSPIKVTWISPLSNVSGDFTFVTLEFRVNNDAIGELPITITYNPDDVYDMTEENIDFEIINGKIQVTK